MVEASEPIGRWGGLTVGIAGGLVLLLMSVALADPQRFSLRCRTETGPWRGCMMRIEAIGERWSLELAEQRFEFRHDGSGQVEMLAPEEAARWRPVRSHWSPERALCWDSLCALGAFPLD